MESGVIRNGDQLEIEVIERIRIISRSGGIIVSVSKKKKSWEWSRTGFCSLRFIRNYGSVTLEMPFRHRRGHPEFCGDHRAGGIHLGEIVSRCFLHSKACA